MNAFRNTLEAYGATRDALLGFDEDRPDLLPYATLLGTRVAHSDDLAVLLGVYEWQSSPLVFFVDGDRLGQDSERLLRIRRRLAMRGDAPYLGVVRPGQLILYRVSLDADTLDQARIEPLPSDQKQATLAYLGNHRPGLGSQRLLWISQVVLKLLNTAILSLRQESRIGDDDAISLVGRALFTRFLADRHLLPPSLIPGGEYEATQLFNDPVRARATSDWLNTTFNGDFLPINPGLFEQLPTSAFRILGDILHRAPGGQLHLGWQEKWDYLDFAHIPVGVLSQAYEHHLSQRPDKQRKEGGYYTPHLIADLMVRGAFHALRRDGVAHTAKVLDPAAGAGVFLLTAFRQLVAERWRHDDKRPDTETLREILYGQITGFDINESALRFAALGLYLLSIEMDPLPEPVQKLRFNYNLRDKVLHKVGEADSNASADPLGSLGEGVGDEHLGHYDLVIGNPPWASATQLPGWNTVINTVARIARTRLPENTPAPPLPNEAMDLPFIWRAMEWARPGGQIAFALHARLLFLQAQGMAEARQSIFRALNVTGVINGAELAGTRVWPGISVPFCLLYARNEAATPASAFRFVSPHLEDALNGVGGFRVDVGNADWVTPEQIAQRPEVLKILFRGSALDLEVFERMAGKGLDTLDGYWEKRFGKLRGHLRFAGNGYQRLRASSRTRKTGDDLPGVSATYLGELPEITPRSVQSIVVNQIACQPFAEKRIHDPRPRDLFRAPLLLIRQSPSATSDRLRVNVSESDVIFVESYHGYSAHTHLDGRRLVRYLAMLLGSRPAYWYALVSSGRFGVERRVVEKMTFGNLPIILFEALEQAALDQIDPLFEALAAEESEDNWKNVDAWAAGIFGLRERDLDVISDTLHFNLPYESSWRAAQSTPRPDEIAAFRQTLADELAPWAVRAGRPIEIDTVEQSTQSPWRLIQISASPGAARPPAAMWPEFWRAADQLAASEIFLPETDCLWVGRLNQARYWSRSQARLLARRIVWEHSALLTGQA